MERGDTYFCCTHQISSKQDWLPWHVSSSPLQPVGLHTTYRAGNLVLLSETPSLKEGLTDLSCPLHTQVPSPCVSHLQPAFAISHPAAGRAFTAFRLDPGQPVAKIGRLLGTPAWAQHLGPLGLRPPWPSPCSLLPWGPLPPCHLWNALSRSVLSDSLWPFGL